MMKAILSIVINKSKEKQLPAISILKANFNIYLRKAQILMKSSFRGGKY